MSQEPPNSPHDSVTRRASNAPLNFSSEQFVLEDAAAPAVIYSKFHAICLIATLTGIMFAGSMSTGLLTVGLPRIAVDVKLQENLLLWPASVYSLTQGCTLLPAGSVADFLGNRTIYLMGCFFLGVFVLATGLARSGIQLILFRAFQGVAISLCLPTAVSILTDNFPNGRRRNVGFACLGLGQPLGFSVGLVLGGFFVDSIGWRVGYYLCAGASIIVFLAGVWFLPRDRHRDEFSWRRLLQEIDWIGAMLASACLGIFSYILAVIAGGSPRFQDSSKIVLLIIATAMVPAFIFWMSRQERLNKPALIPNSLWKNTSFLTICVLVLLSWAVLQSMEWFLSLFFQQVQGLSAIQASLRFLPNVILGIILNVVTGLLVHKVRANHIIFATSFISAASPLLMALVHPEWPYWYAAFWAVLLSPLAIDVLFTVSNLIITDIFPARTHALAGAVLNTVAQFGASIGLALMAVISSAVTQRSRFPNKDSPEARFEGFRVVFWVLYACILVACVVGTVGLRRVGKVGGKKE